MRDRNRSSDSDWPSDDEQPEPVEWANWQIEGEGETTVNCNDGCNLGYDCPCYEAGSDDGYREGENSVDDPEQTLRDGLEEARRGINRLFEKILLPIENQAFLKGNEKALIEADKLREMQREIEEILSS